MKHWMKVCCLMVITLIFLGTLLYNCSHRGPGNPVSGPGELVSGQQAVFVGREACKRCHEKEYNLFTGSDHDLAMDIADSTTVLGNFNNSTFIHFGVTSKFYRKNNDYFVYTEGIHGEMKEFRISYVFGHYPLQQYLIEFPGGRYQCLPLCWDSRPASEGGQRWFHIYNNEKIAPDDILYWTGNLQNWNYMCAECHSTDLKKNYDYRKETYHTSWTEIDVSCEACHGPGSVHILWAEAEKKGNKPDIPFMGFRMSFKDKNDGKWIFSDDSSQAIRTFPHDTKRLLDMCARCHARRGIISEDYIYGRSLLDTHRPSLLSTDLYFPDGQIMDEDYEYASFLQSKMYRAGVFCTDCHDPHSAKVVVSGNALCYRCHSSEKYGSKSHHFHDMNSTGASCTGCHMPTRKFMVVDPRLDHSIRIPRPDLSIKLGTPNACNQCHTDKTAEWAADVARNWYGDPSGYGKHYGEVIAAARKSSPFSREDLIKLTADSSVGPMVRATALSLIGNYPEHEMVPSVINGMADPDPLIRYGATLASSVMPGDVKSKYLFNLLSDSIRLIRINAASILVTSGINPADQAGKDLLGRVTQEYISAQLINADFPSSWLNLGNLYLSQHRNKEAEEAYKKAIELGPTLPYGYINLADLYRQENREDDGEELLRQGIAKNPGMAGVHHALALLLVRKGDRTHALKQLETAVKEEPESAQYSYTLAIALFSSGNYNKAVEVLERALKHSPYDQELLFALSTINRDTGKLKRALMYAKRLTRYYPLNQQYRQLEASLEDGN